MTWTAASVLDMHTALHERLAHPRGFWESFVHWFGEHAAGTMLDGHSRSGAKTPEKHVSMMFYPFRPDQGTSQAAYWCGSVAHSLFQARTYQVTEDMADAVSAIYKTRKGMFHLEPPELPSEHGFAWLDKPLHNTDRWGREVIERVLTWGTVPIRMQFPESGRILESTGVRFASWCHVDDKSYAEYTEGDDWDINSREVLLDRLRKLGPLSLSHTIVVPFGERHKFTAGKLEHPEYQPGDYQPDSTLAWAHAMWMLMEQEIVYTPKAQVPRGAWRRAARLLKNPGVSVVRLRRSHSTLPQEGLPTAVDWSCRWIVQGHHRHIDSYQGPRHHATSGPGQLCGTCWANGEQTRITWVHSHLKGPDGAPIKAAKVVYRLER